MNPFSSSSSHHQEWLELCIVKRLCLRLNAKSVRLWPLGAWWSQLIKHEFAFFQKHCGFFFHFCTGLLSVKSQFLAEEEAFSGRGHGHRSAQEARCFSLDSLGIKQLIQNQGSSKQVGVLLLCRLCSSVPFVLQHGLLQRYYCNKCFSQQQC